MPAKPVVDRVEVLAAEQRTAELKDQGRVLGARELVVQADIVDVGERHRVSSLARSCPLYANAYRHVHRELKRFDMRPQVRLGWA